MKFIGVDPGIYGGISILDETGKIVGAHPMPPSKGYVEPRLLLDLFESFDLSDGWHWACEQSQVRPEQPQLATHKYGIACGVLLGVAHALKPLSISLCRPDVWQKYVWGKYGVQGNDTKSRTAQACLHAYPEESHRWTTPRGKLLDGISDSLGIAIWLRDSRR